MAISFKVRYIKSKDQKTVTVIRDDNVDLSLVTSVVAKVYTSSATPDNTYNFTAQEVTNLIAGTVAISTLNLIGSATPSDDFYSIILECNSAAYVSESAGAGFTLTAIYQALNKQGEVDVFSPDFRVDRVLLTGFMLAWEMDNLELQDASKQQREDFTTRQDTLQKMYNYS